MFKKLFTPSSKWPVRQLLSLCLAVCLCGLALLFSDGLELHASGRELSRRPNREERTGKRALFDAAAGFRLPLGLLPQQQGSSTLQEVKLAASDGQQFDETGSTVAISGTTAVVGAFGHQAYIFVRRGGVWGLQQTLTVGVPSDRESEIYPVSVAIDGDTILLADHIPPERSESNPDGIEWKIGDIYAYVRDGSEWTLQHTFTPPPTPTPYRAVFPTAIAISKDTAIIGLPGIDNFDGAVFFSDRQGTTWSPLQKLSANERSSGDNDFDSFGARVAIEGDTAVVTAPDVDIDTTDIFREGAAYVYVRSGGVWEEQGYLTAAEDELEDTFFMGLSVALSGNTVVVGAERGDNAFVFVRNGTTWSEQQMLKAPDGATDIDFGHGVGISGNKIVVGSPLAEDGLGVAYLYERTGETWFETQTLRATTGVPTTNQLGFGFDADISGDTIIVGAPFEEVNLNDDQGAAYVFQLLDTDGDGLPDEWEKHGVTIEDQFIDLKAMGADPLHKDIFIHADWMGADPARPGVVFKPDPRAIRMVTDAFAIAPVENPDQRPGINLHVDAGPTSVLNNVTGATTTWGALSRAREVPFQATIGTHDSNGHYNWGAVDAVKALQFLPAQRRAVFHYALFANNFSKAGNAGISRGIDAADFIVTLGDWPTPGGTLLEQTGTFMHELGHNLGLRHGGDDDINTKPNYLSIMNYSFSNVGVFQPLGRQRSFDYSRTLLPPLDERNLDEFVGIRDPAMHLTLWNRRTHPDNPAGSNACFANSSYFKSFFPTDALDWNCDGAKTPTPVTADINGDGRCVAPGNNLILDSAPGGDDLIIRGIITAGLNRTCETPARGDDTLEHQPGFVEPPVLTGFNDWPAIRLGGGGSIGDRGAGPSNPTSTLNDEPTLQQLRDAVPESVREEEFVAPLDVVTYSPQTGEASLTVNFDGSASTAVTGTIVDWSWNFGDGTTGSGATVQHTYATPGQYFASLTVTDSNGRVNLVPLLNRVTVNAGTNPTPTPTPTPAPALTNLTPFQPAGWSDKIVVSNITGTNTDSSLLLASDTLKVDFAIINNGGTPTSVAFSAKLYVDGAEVRSFTVNPPLNPADFYFVVDFPVSPLAAGQHEIKMVADENAEITERDETDNEHIKVINVSPAAPTPTPEPSPTPIPVAVTYTVRNTNDSGTDSLRQALIDANNHPNPVGSIDQIVFSIPGSGVHTITPATHLPPVSDAVLIDGYTQPGASANTQARGDDAVLLIELNGANLDEVGLNLTGGNSTIRGLVINNFNSNFVSNMAIRLASSNNVVAGNFIGTNAAGTIGVRNFIGVNVVSGANNLIGGPLPADRNILGGSATQDAPAAGAGVQIQTTQAGTRVLGNYIGTNAAGDAPLGNGRGINVDSKASADITIGGLTSTPGTGAGNVISGNSSNGGINSDGIHILYRPRGDIKIQGNLIGLNATGTEALSNGVGSILIEDASPGTFIATPGTGIILIGGIEPGARNVIFNNRISGISINLGIFSSAADSNVQVQGNFIGTDITGTSNPPLAKGSHSGGNGMSIFTDGSVTIGGNSAAARNVISCQGRGLLINGGVVTVQGNYIGTTVDGLTPLGNNAAGVRVESAAVAIIGGTAPGQGNLIAHNFSAGVEVRNNARATILGNSIFDNGTRDVNTFQGHPGIDLNDDGVTPNDDCDSDNGPNTLQNYPSLTAAVAASDGTLTVTGSLNSRPGNSFRVEFFSNPTCEASGHGEGETFIGSTTVSTDGSCNASINVTLPSVVPVGQFITATATDADGNTSEFSNCVQVTGTNPAPSPTPTPSPTPSPSPTPMPSPSPAPSPAVTSVASVSGSGVFGGTATLIATLTSGNAGLSGKTLTFTINGIAVGSGLSDVNGVATLAGVSLSGLNAGIYSNAVGASFGGNANHASSSSMGALTVRKAVATILLGSLSHIYDGTPKSATATTNPAGKSVLLTYSQNGQPVAFPTNAGSYVVTARTSDANFRGGTANTLVIGKATPLISWSNPSDITYGTALGGTQFNASTTVPGTFTYVPAAGTVLGAGSGQTLAVSFAPTDTANYNAASKSVSINVIKASQTISFGTLADKTFGEADFAVGATVSSGLIVSFSASGNCTVSAGTVHITGAGSCTITASQAGNGNYAAASDVSQSFRIAKAATSTAIVVSPTGTPAVGQPLTFTATVTSGVGTPPTGTVQFKVDGSNLGGPVALSANGVATFVSPGLSAGTHIVRADYGGDLNFEVSTAALDVSPATGSTVEFSQPTYTVGERDGYLTVTVRRTGDKTLPLTVDYATDDSVTAGSVPCSSTAGMASERCDYTTALGTLRFAAGEAEKSFSLLISDDSYVEGDETFSVSLSNPSGGATLGSPGTATVLITDDVTEPTANAGDDSRVFVGQHYHDFLNRQHDTPGFNFWTAEITRCGVDPGCTRVKRQNVSAAFYLSIEFQQTGFQVIRMYKATYAEEAVRPRGLPRYREFLRDEQEISRGVVVGQGRWEEQLSDNLLDFARAWVQRPEVLTALPNTLSGTEYVDTLFLNSGVTPTQAERDAAITDFGTGGVDGRALALISATGSGSVYNRQFNAAFVLMEYIGYLRRNPDDAPESNFEGFDFWLRKLNSFSLPGEDVRDPLTAQHRLQRAEMVRAFIESVEYRQRFGQ